MIKSNPMSGNRILTQIDSNLKDDTVNLKIYERGIAH